MSRKTSSERAPLLGGVPRSSTTDELTMIFAVACIVDQFGVNPIIVLPRAIILCGWVGLPLALVVFSLTIYTAMLLGRCWVIAENIDQSILQKIRYPYAALIEMAWGKTAGRYMSVFLNLGVFTSNIPALLIAAQNLQTFDAKVSHFSFDFSYCYWLIILGIALCPLTWLGSPKDMKWISVASTCAVFSAAILTWTCMMWDNTRAFTFRDIPSPNWQSIAIAYGVLSFQLSCHPAMLAIQTDMHNKTQLSQSILCSFFVTGGLFLITSCMAMMLYGGGIRANLTQGLPSTLPLYMDILIITLQLFLSMAVGGCALFQAVEDTLKISNEFNWKRCVLRTLFVMLAVLIAEGLPRFDLVMGLLGGLFTGPVTLIIPPLLYMRLNSLYQHSTKLVTEEEGPLIEVTDTVDDISAFGEPPANRSRLSSDLSRTTESTLQLGKSSSSCDISDSEYLTAETEETASQSLAETKSSHDQTEYNQSGDVVFENADRVPDNTRKKLFETLDCIFEKGGLFFKRHFFSLDVNLDDNKLSTLEMCILYAIVALGVMATVTASYFSLRGTVWSAKFVPPCLVNIKDASKIIDA